MSVKRHESCWPVVNERGSLRGKRKKKWLKWCELWRVYMKYEIWWSFFLSNWIKIGARPSVVLHLCMRFCLYNMVWHQYYPFYFPITVCFDPFAIPTTNTRRNHRRIESLDPLQKSWTVSTAYKNKDPMGIDGKLQRIIITHNKINTSSTSKGDKNGYSNHRQTF